MHIADSHTQEPKRFAQDVENSIRGGGMEWRPIATAVATHHHHLEDVSKLLDALIALLNISMRVFDPLLELTVAARNRMDTGIELLNLNN